MICPEDILLEHGLVGAFDSIAMMYDEELAIMVEDGSAERIHPGMEDDPDSERVGREVRDLQSLTYIEVQMASQELAAHLYHRFGVRRGDPVAIICHGHSAAEFIACLACARIGAPFVPIDSSWIYSKNGEKLSQIALDARPVAAVVVAESDADAAVIALARVSIHRCALICKDGSAVTTEANISDIPTEIPSIYDDDDTELSIRTPLPALYILYTSGSTGTPKGVLGTHEGLINRLIWQYKRFPYLKRSQTFGDSDMDSVGSDESLSVDSESDVDANADEDADADADAEGGIEEATVCCGSTMHVEVEGMENLSAPTDDEDNASEGVGEDVHCEDVHPAPSVTTPFGGEVTCRRTPLTFVDSMAEMFAPLLAGTPLWAPPPGLIKEKGIAGIVASAAIAGVSRLTLLPSQLSALLLMIPDLGKVWPSLRIVIISGEACDRSLALRFYKACETAQLVNIYGSTEIGADVCYAVLSPPPTSAHHPHLQSQPHPHAHRDLATHALNTSNSNIEDTSDTLPIPQGDASTSPLKSPRGTSKSDSYSASMRASWLLGNAPIGHPIDGNDLYIARIKETNKSGESSVEDLLFELVADGEPGELFVGGKQLAMGYHNRPADTAERFISRKVIIGIDSILQTRVTGREGGGEKQRQKQSEKKEVKEEEEEEGENDHHSPVVRAISTVTDFIAGPTHKGKLFRTGDIVVRIPKGPQVRTPVHSARCDMIRGKMDEDGNGEGQGEEEGTGREVSDTGRDEGNEEERNEVAIIENERMMDHWAGAIVWLGRKDLQVKVRGVRVEIEEVERIIAIAFENESNRVSQRELNNTVTATKKSINVATVIDVTAGIIAATARKMPSDDTEENISDQENCICIREGVAVVGVQNDTKRGHHLVLFIEENILKNTNIADVLHAKKFLMQNVESTYVPLNILSLKRIPRTITGKLDRQILNNLAVESVVLDPLVNISHAAGDSFSSFAKNVNVSDALHGNVESNMEYGTMTKIPQSEWSIKKEENNVIEIVQKIISVYLNVLPPSKHLHALLDVSEWEVQERVEVQEEMVSEIEIGGDVKVEVEVVEKDHKTEVEIKMQNAAASASKGKADQHNTHKLYSSKENSNKDSTILIGRDLDFFTLGGDSMTAVQALWHLESVITLLQRQQNQGKGAESAALREKERTTGQSNLTPSCLKLSIQDLASKIFSIVRTERTFPELNHDESNNTRKRKHAAAESVVRGPYSTHTDRTRGHANDITHSGSSRYTDRPVKNPLYIMGDGGGQSLIRVSVCGRCDKWDWIPHPIGTESIPITVQDPPLTRTKRHPKDSVCVDDERIRVDADVRCDRTDSNAEAVTMQQTGSCNMRKCVDSSPLLIIRHYNIHNTQSSSSLAHTQAQGRLVASNEVINQGDKYRDSVEVGRLYIGSHGGDFVCMDTLTTDIVWTLDLESAFNYYDEKEMKGGVAGAGNKIGNVDGNRKRNRGKVGRNRVHIEGSATCDLSGSVVYIGCFRGNDVDVVEVDDVDDAEDNRGYDSGEEHDTLTQCVGRAFAIEACSGNILWCTPIAGEIKCAIAVDHYRSLILVGTYDSSLYVLSQSTGEVLDKIDCGGSIYATPVISTISCAGLSKEGEGNGGRVQSSECVSTLVYVATTQGRLAVLSYIGVHEEIRHSVTSTASSSSSISVTGSSSKDSMMSVVWSYHASAPIFATPLITTTAIVAVSSNDVDVDVNGCVGVAAGVGYNRWRRDLVIIGAVDGTIKCLAVTSTILLGGRIDRLHGLPGISCSGEELWKVSFASKPIFSSPCCVQVNNTMSEYHQTARDSHHTKAIHDMNGTSIGFTSRSKIPTTVIPFLENQMQSPEPSQFLTPQDCVVVFGAHDGVLRAVSPGGLLLWETDLGSVIFSSPCTIYNRIVIGATTAGTVYAVDCREGSVLAVQQYGGVSNTENSNSTADPSTVSLTQSSEQKGRIIPQCGKILTSTRLSGEVYSSPVVRGGCIFLGCRDDKVHRIALSIHPHTSS